MKQATAIPLLAPFVSRRTILTAAVGSAAVVLSACSNSGAQTSGTETSAVTGGTAASSQATDSASAAATASPSPAAPPVTELVAGFPSSVLVLMPGAMIEASSIEKSEPLSTASVTASVTATSAEVLEFYTGSFTRQGFTAQPGDSVDGIPSKTFLRAGGQESVTVSVVQSGAKATFTLGATLLAASFQ